MSPNPPHPDAPKPPIQPAPVFPGQNVFVPQQPPPPFASRKESSFKRGFGLGMGLGTSAIVFGIVMSLFSMMTLIGMAAALANEASPATAVKRTRTIWGKSDASKENTIRAISISGPIHTDSSSGLGFSASTIGYEIAATINSLNAEDAAGIVLLINTPGGTITGSRAIADAVESYQKRTKKKVIAYVQGMSASGGMYAMAGADEIISDYGTLVGSIGVIFGPFVRYKDVVATGSTLVAPGVVTKGGITQEYLSKGKGKDFGNPFREMSADERANLQNGIDREYKNFVDWVATHRKIDSKKIVNELGAYVFDPETAMKHGLIDSIMGRPQAFAHAAKQMGLDENEAAIVVATAPSFFESMFGAESRIYGYSVAVSGQGSVATSELCTGAPTSHVVYGSLKTFCG